jgi:hypothetical protein
LLAGNRIQRPGVHSITEFAWDSVEALRELDLSENEIAVSGDLNGDDPVSALLRCFYNHSAYPRRIVRTEWVPGRREAFDLEPLILRLNGNFIKDPVRLLGQVCEKGGRERVRLRPGPEVYHPCCEEFLSLCLPDFSRQRGSTASAIPAAQSDSQKQEEWSAPDLDDLEERLVQQALAERLSASAGESALSGESSDAARWTIAGLALALVDSGKPSGKIVSELESFVGNAYARPLLEWLVSHLRTLRC